jgi:hypothetical protein
MSPVPEKGLFFNRKNVKGNSLVRHLQEKKGSDLKCRAIAAFLPLGLVLLHA